MSDYVPIKDSLLDKEKLSLKRQWDAEWQTDSDQRAAAFYARKKAGLTTAQEDADFLSQDAVLWKAEEQRRIESGLYREKTKEELETTKSRLETEVSKLASKIEAMK